MCPDVGGVAARRRRRSRAQGNRTRWRWTAVAGEVAGGVTGRRAAEAAAKGGHAQGGGGGGTHGVLIAARTLQTEAAASTLASVVRRLTLYYTENGRRTPLRSRDRCVVVVPKGAAAPADAFGATLSSPADGRGAQKAAATNGRKGMTTNFSITWYFFDRDRHLATGEVVAHGRRGRATWSAAPTAAAATRRRRSRRDLEDCSCSLPAASAPGAEATSRRGSGA